MFESLKRLTTQSSVYGIGHIVTRSVGFLLLPLYTNELTTSEFGVAALMFLYLAIFNVVYLYGLDSAFLRFFILEEEANRKRIFTTAFISILGTGLVVSVILFTNAGRIAVSRFGDLAYTTIVIYGVGILFFDALGTIAFLILRAREQATNFVVLKLLNVVVNVGLNVVFIRNMGMGVDGVFLANVLSSGFTLLTLLPTILRHLGGEFSRSVYRELLAFGLPYVPSGLAVILMDLLDRELLKHYLSLDDVGIYSAAYKLAQFMNVFVAAFRFAWHPFFLSTSKQEDAREIFSRVLTYFLLACSGIYLGITFFVDDLVRFNVLGTTVFGADFWQGTSVVPVVMLAYVMYGVYVNLVVGIHLEKKTKYLPMITGLAAVVNVVSCVILIPRLGILGAAWATLLGYSTMTAALYLVVQRLYRVEYQFGRIARLAVAVILMVALVKQDYIALNLVSRVLAYLAFPVLLYVLRFFEARELNKVRGFLGRLR